MCLPRTEDSSGAGGSEGGSEGGGGGGGAGGGEDQTNSHDADKNSTGSSSSAESSPSRCRSSRRPNRGERTITRRRDGTAKGGDHEAVVPTGWRKRLAWSRRWWWGPEPLCYALVAAAATLTYANSLNGEFVHDDLVAIVKNGDVRGDGPWLRTFANDFWGVPMKDPSSHKSYRPLTTLTFRMNAFLGGENVIGYHVVNVILHVIVSVQLADLCRRCLAWDWLTSLTAAILFATHPVHTEAVSSVVGRAELLCSTFFLLGLSLYIRCGGERGGGRLAVVCGSAFCAMLAKEQGVTLVLVCLTYDLIYRHGNRWRRRKSLQSFIQRALDKSTVTLIASLAMMLGFRIWILQGSMPQFSDQDNPASHSPHFLTRLLTYLYLPAFNVWLLLCPLTLAYDWQLGSIPLVNNLSDPRNLVSAALYVSLAILLRKLWTVPKSPSKEELTIGFCLLTLPFLPAANLCFPVGFVVAERILYTPSIGYCILVARGMRAISGQRASFALSTLLRGGATLLIALLWLRSVRRNEDWANRDTLFRSGLRSTPDNAKVHYNYANLQKDNGQTELAVEHYRKALSLWPNYVSAHNNLGTLLVDLEEAELHFKTAMWLDPKHARAHYNLAALYRRRRQPEVVLWLLNRAIELDPELDEAYALLTSIYAENKKGQVAKIDTKEKLTTEKWLKSSQRQARSTASEGVINQTAGSANRPTSSALLYPMSVGKGERVIKR